jgi:hypothetical protein
MFQIISWKKSYLVSSGQASGQTNNFDTWPPFSRGALAKIMAEKWYNNLSIIIIDCNQLVFFFVAKTFQIQPSHKGLAMQADVAFCFMPGA